MFDTPHQKYLSLVDTCVGLRNKKVLEVGGCSPMALLAKYRPAQWECVNLDARAVARFNADAEQLGTSTCGARFQDVASVDAEESCDIIYSINSFEHIQDLERAFDVMFRALRPGGYLFTVFGPIWSSDVGHHVSVPTEKGALHFFDGVLEPWEHLTSTPDAIKRKLESRYGADAAERATNFIFNYPDLNRLFEHQYLSIVAKSGFAPVMILRNKKGTPPAVAGATRTREFVMILKKGTVEPWERAASFLRFGWAYFRSMS